MQMCLTDAWELAAGSASKCMQWTASLVQSCVGSDVWAFKSPIMSSDSLGGRHGRPPCMDADDIWPLNQVNSIRCMVHFSNMAGSLNAKHDASQDLSEALAPVVTVPMIQNHELVICDIESGTIKQALRDCRAWLDQVQLDDTKDCS